MIAHILFLMKGERWLPNCIFFRARIHRNAFQKFHFMVVVYLGRECRESGLTFVLLFACRVCEAAAAVETEYRSPASRLPRGRGLVSGLQETKADGRSALENQSYCSLIVLLQSEQLKTCPQNPASLFSFAGGKFPLDSI